MQKKRKTRTAMVIIFDIVIICNVTICNLLAFHKRPVHYYKLHLILNKTKEGNKEIIETFNKGLKSLKDLLGNHTVTRPCLSLAKGVVAKNEEAERHLKYIKELCP